jgi:hypothetical protein
MQNGTNKFATAPRGRLLPLLALTLALGTLPGCSLKRFAVDQTAKILLGALPAFETEWDFELVEASLPANIKTVEGFLLAAPDNEDLLMMVAQAYTSYALVVLEDRLEQTEEEAPAFTPLAQRTREMYLRGHRHGLRLLDGRHPGAREAVEKGKDALAPLLARCTARDVPALFWTGMPLAGAVNVARDDVTMISRMPIAKALIGRALELDEGYYHAGSHMIIGSILGSIGKMLGGDPDQARKHFERALELTGRKFLLVQVMYAKTVGVQVQDRALFEKLLGEVVKADLGIYPEQKLANVAAKRRARRLSARAGELF